MSYIPGMDEFEYELEDQGLEHRYDERERTCLMCGESFPSAWAGERICKKCKSQTRWRSGDNSLSD